MMSSMSKLLRIALMAGGLALSTSALGSALKLDVYITSDMEVYAPTMKKLSAFNVHVVDGLAKQEKMMSATLPKDPQQAELRVKEFIESGELEQQAHDIIGAWTTINSVVSRGIEKVPAVVINDKYVVYGMNPTKAIRAYENYLIKHGTK